MATSPHILANYNKYARNGGAWWAPSGSAELFAGDVSGNEYGSIFGFDFSAYTPYTITAIGIYVYRFEDGQSASRTLTAQIATAPGADMNHVALVAGATTTFSFAQAGAWESFALTAAQINAIKAGADYLYLTGGSNSYVGLRPKEYSGGAYAAYAVVTYSPYPALTTPIIGPVTDEFKVSSLTVSCKAGSSDSTNLTSASNFYYDVELSTDGGITWNTSKIYSGAKGSTSVTINLLTHFDLVDSTQYFNSLNTKARIRSRVYYGTTWYYSGWSTSAVFKIDNRIVPSAPNALTATVTDLYEGQAVTNLFTVGHPDQYNHYDANKAAMQLHYYLELVAGGLPLVDGIEPASTDIRIFDCTVGEILLTKDDLVSAVQVKVIDAASQFSPYKTGPTMTIRRFRSPEIVIVDIIRTATAAEVHFTVTDTGFGTNQDNTQINKDNIRYSVDGGANYITLPTASVTWSGLTGVFTVSGLAENQRVDHFCLALYNIPPSGLTAKPSNVPDVSIIEYTPAFFVWRRSNPPAGQAITGAAAQALIVGSDYGVDVEEGSAVIEQNLDVGGALRQGGVQVKTSVSSADRILGRVTDGAGEIEEIICTAAARTLLDDADVVTMRSTLALTALATLAFTNWANWTVTPSGWVLGNGTLVARYCKIGKLVLFNFLFTYGSTSAVTGDYLFNLPSTPANRSHFEASITDSGTAVFEAFAESTGGSCRVRALGAGGTYVNYVACTNAIPMTWAANDSVCVTGMYEEQ